MKLIRLISLAILAISSCGNNSNATPDIPEQEETDFVVAAREPDIFVGKTEGYHTFRIPAIAKTVKGTLLAFCEGRKDSGGDSGDIDLVLRRSIDGGKTWGRLQVVWDHGGNTCGNPSPVIDPETGRIHLLMTWNLGTDKAAGDFNNGVAKDTRRVFYSWSDDDGKTWSKPVEITNQAKKPEWGWYATGPCHAIILKNGAHKGRIVVPCDANEKIEATGVSTGYSHIIYSDDKCKTWKIGGTVKGGNESSVAELEDGRIFITCRASGGKRLIAWSSDGGETFTAGKSCADLPDPRCQGAVLSTDWNGKRYLLHVNCADASSRVRLTVKGTAGDGNSWNAGYPMPAPHTAYSDIVMVNDNVVGLLYENGESGSYEKISYQRIAVSYILK